MNSRLKVSGNIISELSEKIPSDIFALNELIKNSYDAGATNVKITLDSINHKLLFADDGDGMTESDIGVLLHISKSVKKYGDSFKNGRYIQGSKGLGFLAVFKFGKKVEWRTKSDAEKGYCFSLDRDEVVKTDDISDYDVVIIEDESIEKGTTISIELDTYNETSLLNFFAAKENRNKIINAFYHVKEVEESGKEFVVDDVGFEIKLITGGTTYSSADTKALLENGKDELIYHIKYNSTKGIIEFYCSGDLVVSKEFEFKSIQYKLCLELVALHLKPYGKKKIDPLFYNSREDLTPLVFINGNLFNNYDLFDPNIMRSIKTEEALPQLIGYVSIISNDESISFNSDRTQFLQNKLTDEIRAYISSINQSIQRTGAKYKNNILHYESYFTLNIPAEFSDEKDDEKFRSFIKDDFIGKKITRITRCDNKVKFTTFGKTVTATIAPKEQSATSGQKPNIPPGTTANIGGSGSNTNGQEKKITPEESTKNTTLVAAMIILTANTEEHCIPTEQIDLKEYIDSACNSSGATINNELIDISVDEVLSTTKILPSFNSPSQKTITYKYNDTNTGLVQQNLVLTFVESTTQVVGSAKKYPLITIQGKDSYRVTYSSHVSDLINQINSLDATRYNAVIACSMRAIFELSVDKIRNSSKASLAPLRASKKNLADSVAEIITHIKNDNPVATKISTSSGQRYSTLNNLLNENEFKQIIEKAHLGAHKAGVHVLANDLKSLGAKAGLFVVLINELITNNQIS